ncbi:hypothetical protein QR685DRAFT_602175 [Neurospora intermedia]|uniref:Uncharacterized protein n=1 Tax=Neurospora intermedia TaxID=5142 RepID=A0ABR3DQ41_NEUIN
MGKVSKHTVTKIINVKRDVKQPGLFRSHRHSTTGTTTTPTIITILITGFNRRLCCRLLLFSYLQRLSKNVIVAAVRNPLHPTSQSLSSLPIHPSGTLRLPIVKIGANHGIDIIDETITNALTGYVRPKVREAEVNNRIHIAQSAAVPDAALHDEEPWLISFSIDQE